VATIAIAAFLNLARPTDPRPPAGWVAVDTHLGSLSHGTQSPLAEYRAAQEIQQQALSQDAKVIVFPETVVPYWTASTDAFWEPTLAALRASEKTILVGARIPIDGPPSRSPADLALSLAVLRGERPNGTSNGFSAPIEKSPAGPRYFNAMVVRGAHEAVVGQRIPVPIAMWNPFRRNSARLNLAGAGLVQLRKERVGVLICYEQLIVWPAVMTMIQNPTVFIAPANDYWAISTTIPTFQRTAIKSWARLFGIPCLFAMNT